jgi:hypothetical protein
MRLLNSFFPGPSARAKHINQILLDVQVSKLDWLDTISGRRRCQQKL